MPASSPETRLAPFADDGTTLKVIVETCKADALIEEIEHFFVSYNEIKGKQFVPTARKGPRAARTIVEQAAARHAASRKRR